MAVLPITRPKNIQDLLSPTFGIPKGAPGRNGNVIQGIVLHCLKESLEEYDQLVCKNHKIGKAKPSHASMHYAIGYSGGIHQYVEDANIAWGFADYLSNFPGPYPVSGLNWALVTANPTVSPDYYVLHIGLESGVPINDNECVNCAGPTVLDRGGYRQLVHLLAYLAQTYSIPLDTGHVQFDQAINVAAEDECQCHDIVLLLADVAAYCEPCESPADPLPDGTIFKLRGMTDPTCADVGCDVYQDGDAFVKDHESPWVGTAGPGITITPGGLNGHAPRIEINPCTVPTSPGTIANVMGKDSAGCLVTEDGESFVVARETPITIADTASIDLASSGVNGHTLQADAKISAAAENVLQVNLDGLYVPRGADVAVLGPIVGEGTNADPLDIDFALLDSADLCDLGNVIPSGLVNEVAGKDATGCLVAENAQQFVTDRETPIAVVDTPSIDLTSSGVNGHTLQADVKVSNGIGNQITTNLDGIYVPQGANVGVVGPIVGTGTAASPLDVDFSLLDNGDLCDLGGVIPGGLLDNLVGQDGAGCLRSEDLAAAVLRSETPFTGIAGNGVTITPGGVNGHAPTVEARLSGDAGNQLVIGSDGGLYVDPETIISPIDTASIDLTLSGPDSHTLQADAKISADVGNALVVQPDGLYVPQGANVAVAGPIIGAGTAADPLDIDFAALDSADFCDLGSAVPAGTVDELFGRDASNCFVAEPLADAVVRSETPFAGIAGDGITITPGGVNGHAPTVEARLSADAGNQAVIGSDGGLFIPAALADTPLTVVDTPSVNLSASGTDLHTLQADVIVSPAAGNALVENADGMYVPDLCTELAAVTNAGFAVPGITQVLGADCQTYIMPAATAETPLAVVDTPSINLTASGASNHTLQADAKISTAANNQLSILADGLYAAPDVDTPLTVIDTTTVNLTANGTDNHTLQAAVILSAATPNAIVALPTGLWWNAAALTAAAACAVPATIVGGDNLRYNWSQLDTDSVLASVEQGLVSGTFGPAVGVSQLHNITTTITNPHPCKSMDYIALVRSGRVQFAQNPITLPGTSFGNTNLSVQATINGPTSAIGGIASATLNTAPIGAGPNAWFISFPADIWVFSGTLAPGASQSFSLDIDLNIISGNAVSSFVQLGRSSITVLGVHK